MPGKTTRMTGKTSTFLGGRWVWCNFRTPKHQFASSPCKLQVPVLSDPRGIQNLRWISMLNFRGVNGNDLHPFKGTFFYLLWSNPTKKTHHQTQRHDTIRHQTPSTFSRCIAFEAVEVRVMQWIWCIPASDLLPPRTQDAGSSPPGLLQHFLGLGILFICHYYQEGGYNPTIFWQLDHKQIRSNTCNQADFMIF